MSAPHIKPCPFCGGEAKYELAYGIRCLSCASHVPCGGDDYGPWNRRADLPPKVRAMEWRVQSSDCQFADTPWGGTAVQNESHALAPNRWGWWMVGSGEDDCPSGYGDTIEAAKAAAQADYEARILAALVQP